MVKMVFPVRYDTSAGSKRPLCKEGQPISRDMFYSAFIKSYCELKSVIAETLEDCLDKAVEQGYFLEDTAQFKTI